MYCRDCQFWVYYLICTVQLARSSRTLDLCKCRDRSDWRILCRRRTRMCRKMKGCSEFEECFQFLLLFVIRVFQLVKLQNYKIKLIYYIFLRNISGRRFILRVRDIKAPHSQPVLFFQYFYFEKVHTFIPELYKESTFIKFTILT